jgi:hypothetical protein
MLTQEQQAEVVRRVIELRNLRRDLANHERHSAYQAAREVRREIADAEAQIEQLIDAEP